MLEMELLIRNQTMVRILKIMVQEVMRMVVLINQI